MFFDKIELPKYNHKLTKKQLISIGDYMRAMDYAYILIEKQENGEYTYNSEVIDISISNTCLELNYEEVVNILNNMRELGDNDKVQITQTQGPIGITTKITTSKRDDIDVTDYSLW